MYSGSTLTKYSGRVMGAHQKIDRIARRHLVKLVGNKVDFPTSREILYFEGKNGPDAIKRKSPAKDELWHYYNPFDDSDTQIVEIIQDHYQQLVKELRASNRERVAFEAAWLAHAIVDGLTPAHHFPYEEKLAELRGGEGIETRTTIKGKIVMPGETKREQVKNNWKMWGPKGLMTTHGLFEIGVASIIAPLSFADTVPTIADLRSIEQLGLAELFRRTAREIAVLDMYTRYQQKGWTPKLAYEVRHKLGPLIINNVTLAWFSALLESGLISKDYENYSRKVRRKNIPKS
ncbi:hypothetical protein KC968_04010 [Candidatus Saccharibacteria bacterium]|nr:hypothetical protein [Candidatus Saccharibacteria bacterium]